MLIFHSVLGCLKEFLSVVPHDRKFFLPETGRVLRRTVCDLKDFTAQNALVGFEAISQYANNLFTKHWRKEFRVLKVGVLSLSFSRSITIYRSLICRPTLARISMKSNRICLMRTDCFWRWAIAVCPRIPLSWRDPYVRIR